MPSGSSPGSSEYQRRVISSLHLEKNRREEIEAQVRREKAEGIRQLFSRDFHEKKCRWIPPLQMGRCLTFGDSDGLCAPLL